MKVGRVSFQNDTMDLGFNDQSRCVNKLTAFNSLLFSRNKTAAKQRRSNRPSTLKERTMDSISFVQ